MTLEKICELELVNDKTEIFVRDDDFHLLARGEWFTDRILDHMKDELERFTWQDDNKLYIDVKKKED